MKKIELTQATEALVEYVKTIEAEPVVIVHRGFALAALVPLGNMDYETHRSLKWGATSEN